MARKPIIEDDNVIELSDLMPTGEIVTLHELLDDYLYAAKGDKEDALEDLLRGIVTACGLDVEISFDDPN